MSTPAPNEIRKSPHQARHWSVDFVEHLRTVHFTLIAACFGLLLLSSSTSKTEVQIAHDQILQIQELLHNFKGIWFSSDMEKRVQELNIPQLKPGFAFKAIIGTWELHGSLKKDGYGGKYVITGIPESHGRNAVPQLPEALEHVPSTLKGFRELWNQNLTLVIPTAVSTRLLNGRDAGDMKFEESSDSSDSQQLYLSRMDPVWVDILRKQFPEANPDVCYCREGAPPLRIPPLIVPVKSWEQLPYEIRAVLIANSNPNWDWKHNDYSHAFLQLGDITSAYEDLEISKVEKILADEEKRTGESFEVAGIKFPAESTTRWGVLLIVGIQIYLWIHLRESLRLDPDDPGWDVAWVGVYRSVYARVAMFITVCILPVGATLSLGIRNLLISSYSLTAIGMTIVSVLVILFLGFLIWNRLPHTTEPLHKRSTSGSREVSNATDSSGKD